MRLPLVAACGLLATSLLALALSIADRGDRAVGHLVTVPGVTQVVANGGFGLAAPSGTSPYATYHAPANPPPPTPVPAAVNPPAAPQPAVKPTPIPKIAGGGGRHHRG